MRAEAVQRLAGLGSARADVVDAARDANVDDEHDPEGATIAFERAQLEALAADARGQLAEIDAALARLADGTYGRCAVGGEPIAPGRLAARPTATTCMEHARRHVRFRP
ncbi:TraR/DksA C4-type zinc finger protein [Cellulomonas sp. HZM]|uniref:TraR/DksA family transcriptional regulator n=1 Tax=Cellulomonas sp. HZM TaxID=1454010 RepID=UPI000689B715|nr:TraR/DksA C4-type zinc finger protein [Cellulomonas sp. HZM]